MQFDITFKNKNERTYHLIAFIYVVLHVLFFIYLLFDTTLWKQGIAGIVLSILYSAYRLVISKTRNLKFFYGEGIFFLFSMFFTVTGWWWLFVLELIISTFCMLLFQKRSVYVNPFLIEYKARPYKRYKWNEISNIILKDNILTLDFKNNKLIQGEIETSVDENAFNTFAKQQLNKA
ncbi:MAG: hypothetical protein H0W75_10150 [Chitinophagaceae bacterium]|nr:hypothetical protein [Chitinophagaceae bacterium]